MSELSMPVRIFRGNAEIGVGELLPNGSNLALCPEIENLQILQYEADTEKVEAKIPMEFWREDKVVAKGELYYSGENYCLCPTDQDIELLDPQAHAELFVEAKGTSARVDINCANSKRMCH